MAANFNLKLKNPKTHLLVVALFDGRLPALVPSDALAVRPGLRLAVGGAFHLQDSNVKQQGRVRTGVRCV